MKKSLFRTVCIALIFTTINVCASASEFNRMPRAWKWITPTDAVFSYDGSYMDKGCFSVNATRLASGKSLEQVMKQGVKAPEKYNGFAVVPAGAVDLQYSPDSSMIAFTRANDLYVVDIATRTETRLTFDGTDLILNGYASWVYFEEIFGRPDNHRTFWWSPDSRRLAFYRSDNTKVPLFPIYSPFGQDGKLVATRYPKAGEHNPEVKIGMVEIPEQGSAPEIVWADFDSSEDQYFGIPFWGPDSKEFFVSRMPRVQQQLDVYAVSAIDGSKKQIYHEYYPTWINWIENVIFTDKGLYMARSFETGWQQIYYLSYDGKTCDRLTEGENWDISLLRLDEKTGDIYFTAYRDATTRQGVYKLDAKHNIIALTDENYDVRDVTLSPDCKYFIASYSNGRTPKKVAVFETSRPKLTKRNAALLEQKMLGSVVADEAGADYDPSRYVFPQPVFMTTDDGFTLPGLVWFPKSLQEATGRDAAMLAADATLGKCSTCENFLKCKGLVDENGNASISYPVHFEVYGGPDTKYVRDRWRGASYNNWYTDNDIIHIVVDPRSAGHHGRAGEDQAYRQLTVCEMGDYVEWAKWVSALPYVNPDKIGVEGFSFGGATTVMLLSRFSEYFHYGIAGGGVYDWSLYDTHYTERFMDTPQHNPDGYAIARALDYVKTYPVEYASSAEDAQAIEPVMLKITHGTGDDNVHFQNTLQLIDELQRLGKKFEFMIYPDGMHGYRGYQGSHSQAADRDFWLRYLKDEK